MVVISRIVSYAGLVVGWVGFWISTNTVAALVIIGGTLLLIGGSAIIGVRRRRAGDTPAGPEAARRSHDRLRAALLWQLVALPVICVLILIYVDSTLGRALVIGGLLVSAAASIPADRAMLARLQTQAEAANSTNVRGGDPRRTDGSA